MAKRKTMKEEVKIEEISYFFEHDRMIFEVGGLRFALPRKEAVFLFGDEVENEFLRTEDKDEDFSAIHTIENILTWILLKKTHPLPSGQVAAEMGISESKLLRWVSKEGHKFTQVLNREPEKTEEIRKEVEGRFPLEQETRPTVEMPAVNFKKAAKIFLDAGRDLDKTATALGLKKAEFMLFWNKNLVPINRQIRSIQISQDVRR